MIGFWKQKVYIEEGKTENIIPIIYNYKKMDHILM